MTSFSIATFNVKNLIGADREYYRFESYTAEEHAWKADWLSDQLLAMDADIVGFQEIFEEDALAAVVAQTNEKGGAVNAISQPDPSAFYARRMIFRKLRFSPYPDGALAWLANSQDTGEPGRRRPGLAILSRHPFREPPTAIQELEEPVRMNFAELGGAPAGGITVSRLSRPLLRARISVDGQPITVFNCHLKSKLGEYETRPAPEEDLLSYDPVGRAMGTARALMRRAAEAVALRRLVVEEQRAGAPVIVLGDFNDAQNAVTSEIIAGETPFKNYSWVRRHDAERASDRYSRAENERIQDDMSAMRLESAEKMFIRRSLRDVMYTASFGGVYESIDQILLSRPFQEGPAQEWTLDYLKVFNDHLTDGSHEEAPYNKLASDHGQLVATLRRL